VLDPVVSVITAAAEAAMRVEAAAAPAMGTVPTAVTRSATLALGLGISLRN